jgi:drug/metabolite transporter (DMT)-like permease
LSKRPFVLILFSAVLFGISLPLAKLLTTEMHPIALAGFLYLGAFVGLGLFSLERNIAGRGRQGGIADKREASLRKKDLPWLAAATIAGGVLGPICLMAGLARTSGFSASLLLNLEGVATALIAMRFFKEEAPRRLWLALGAMTVAGVCLTWDPGLGRFNIIGPLLITLAMVCWGLDNNFTRNISDKDPVQIAGIKGLFAGAISLSLVVIFGINLTITIQTAYALLVGALCYGLSLVLFIKALQRLGAFRAGAFFSLAPFIGAAVSLVILREPLGIAMLLACLLMVVGVWLIITEKHAHAHRHERLMHFHFHTHGDLHHSHLHPEAIEEPHSHEHTHEALDHIHGHWPDIHHRHVH